MNKLLPKIQRAVSESKDDLSSEIEFPNGLIKKNAWNNIIYFNNIYHDEYGFDIIS